VELADRSKFEIAHYLVFDDRGDIVRASLNLEHDILPQLKQSFTTFNSRGLQESKKQFYSTSTNQESTSPLPVQDQSFQQRGAQMLDLFAMLGKSTK